MIVRDRRLKSALLRALADERAMSMIQHTVTTAKSVKDLVKECDIPHTTAYRLISQLRSDGLLIVEKEQLTPDGKKYDLYRAVFGTVSVEFNGLDVEVRATLNGDIIDRAYRIFYSLISGRE